MWTCPKCKESIEDQFDSCWKCAGTEQSPPPKRDLAWLYPLISFSALALFCLIAPSLTSSPKHPEPYFTFGGALAGAVLSGVAVWAFLSCPLHHWIAKALTLLILFGALFFGIVTIGSFFIHVLGYAA